MDGGRNPEEVAEALEPSHWRETPSTPIPAENDMAHLVADLVHTWRLQAAWRYFARGVLRRRRRYWGLHLAEVWLTNLIDERSRLP